MVIDPINNSPLLMKHEASVEANSRMKFEDRCLSKLFKVWGVSGALLNIIRRKTDNELLTCDWFNYRAMFPAKLMCYSVTKEASFVSTVKSLMWASKRIEKTPIGRYVGDLLDAYPEENVGFITRFTDSNKDYIVHDLELDRRDLGFGVVFEMWGSTFTLQPVDCLKESLESAGYGWSPKDI